MKFPKRLIKFGGGLSYKSKYPRFCLMEGGFLINGGFLNNNTPDQIVVWLKNTLITKSNGSISLSSCHRASHCIEEACQQVSGHLVLSNLQNREF